MGPVVQLKTRRLFESINSAAPRLDMRLPLCLMEQNELRFWLESLHALNDCSLRESAGAERVVACDASASAAGAIYVDRAGHRHVATSVFSPREAAQSSTYRELITVLFALQSFSQFLKGKRVVFQTDNMGVTAIVRKGSGKSNLQAVAEQIYVFCTRNACSLEVVWVPREDNTEADEASRIVDFDDWGVRAKFFEICDKKWGPHTIDRFADHRNTKLPRFNSKFFVPGTEAVEAFACNWAWEMNWLTPPISLIIRTVKHLEDCRGRGTLAVPEWPTKAFFALLRPDGVAWAPFVKDVLRFPPGTRLFNPATQFTSVFNEEFSRSPFLFLLLDFSPQGL
uniref:RNase H type-1 domain-containing protein n=1 Tax=Plectus sambesii TaxID=2011161 RepID=A0A914WRW9_9BILA